MDIFNLYRNFWNWSFDNPEKIKPTHVSIFSFAVEHCNRLGWKDKFGFPTSMVMEATGIKSYSVYKKHFDDLITWKLIEIIEYSKNQYSSNIIALKENNKAPDEALDKAFVKHTSKQSESTLQSIESIIIQINNKQYTNSQINKLKKAVDEFLNVKSDKIIISDADIENVYNAYPNECPIKGSRTGKSKANKEKIKKILESGDYSTEQLISIINAYDADCTKNRTYMKNFGTFLNNIPDYGVKPVIEESNVKTLDKERREGESEEDYLDRVIESMLPKPIAIQF